MRLLSFDPLRTLKLPPHTSIKPEHFFQYKDEIRSADWVLFPEYWQISPLIFGLQARIFPSLPTYLIGHNKIEITRAVEMVAPEHLPWTLIRANTATEAEAVWDSMPLPFVAKIPKSSMGEGVFLIENRSDWRNYLQQTDVIYAQEYLPIDRDLRILWIGDSVFGGYWRVQSANGFHNNVARGGQVIAGQLPVAAVELVTRVARALKINYAGFDIAMVDHYPYLLEFNRMFGSQGIESTLGDPTEHLLEYLQRTLHEDDPHNPKSPRDPLSGGLKRSRRRVRRAA